FRAEDRLDEDDLADTPMARVDVPRTAPALPRRVGNPRRGLFWFLQHDRSVRPLLAQQTQPGPAMVDGTRSVGGRVRTVRPANFRAAAVGAAGSRRGQAPTTAHPG